AQQSGIDVEAALTPVRLLDDDGDELRDDVLMINHGKQILFCCPAYIGAKAERFKDRSASCVGACRKERDRTPGAFVPAPIRDGERKRAARKPEPPFPSSQVCFVTCRVLA